MRLCCKSQKVVGLTSGVLQKHPFARDAKEVLWRLNVFAEVVTAERNLLVLVDGLQGQ
jgi:hypothetical protein